PYKPRYPRLSFTTPLPQPIPTLFPYTTLFRSEAGDASRNQSKTAAEKYRAGPAIAPLGHAAGRKGLRDHRQNGRLICACSHGERDRKSTRLNSSHQIISYAVFCLKKKRKK